MDFTLIVVLVVFAVFGLACFWMGARIAKNEPIYEANIDVELAQPADYMGATDGEELEE